MKCAYCSNETYVARCESCGAPTMAKPRNTFIHVKVPPAVIELIMDMRETDRRWHTMQDCVRGITFPAYVYGRKTYYFEVDSEP